jgi:hypothetical protein
MTLYNDSMEQTRQYGVGIKKEPTCKYMNSVSKGKYLER